MIGLVALNLGGPDSLDAVEPFLLNLFRDPAVIQLPVRVPGLQGLLARFIVRRRGPASRAAYRQIGGASTIAADSATQAAAVAAELGRRGVEARSYVAMACWHPFSHEAVAAMRRDGIARAVALPLFPHFSHTTTGSSFDALDRAITAAGGGIEVARVRGYADHPGFIEALSDRLTEALLTLPPEHRDHAPIVFSAHGLPVSYVRRGDPYLDEIRTTVAAVERVLGLRGRSLLAFQSRVGRGRWLRPYTDEAIDALAGAGERAIVVCPVAFTGEHIETLQEIDILYRERATAAGITHFARAHTVDAHPAFIAALADCALGAAAQRGWA